MNTIRQKHRGFTVPELMIVVAILGLLVAFSFGAYNSAVAHSRASRTKVVIAKLDQLVMERWESYRTRPVPIRVNDPTKPLTFVPPNHPQFAQLAAQKRLYALREIMRMELPNTRADVLDNPVYVARTAINRGYLRKVPSTWSETWQQAECLYLIVASMRDHDKSALDFFTNDEIGDLDQDGVPEILDGWGNPIQFIRWPVGYRSDAPIPAVTMQNSSTPDSFDPLKAHDFDGKLKVTTFDLKPLIYSFGPDKIVNAGIILPDSGYSSTEPPNDPFSSSFNPPVGSIAGYGDVSDAEAAAAAADNITNHFQEAE
jgi:prepilin-type N-terminal cleavage/methylation domain-containing protein